MLQEISETTKHWMALSSIKGVGPNTIKKLINRFGSPKDIFSAPVIEIARMVKLNLPLAQEIADIGTNLESFEKIIRQLSKTGIQVLCPDSLEYPVLLKDIGNFPPILYMKGKESANGKNLVAIVGTRLPTAKGRQIAERIAEFLAKKSFTVVSGLAKGIDTAAHRGALKANGKTIGVLGSGLNMIYPRENLKLAHDICATGAILSECHPSELVSGQRLIQRNRIISGMCPGIILIEPGESGALNAAQWALKQKKHIFLYNLGSHKIFPETLLKEVIFLNSLDSMDTMIERLLIAKEGIFQTQFI